ncbi:hypothetical protein HW090_14165 [Pseudomonas sp. ABC1]|uniref:hypothetical protein n=1 Tax=Pseudomonas sp. ABC1 TaxID=2748080 RepID=UPI0015C386A7|nr:hypothetical protein [Pseudomonas sp. ABC1]QLF94279.1 hypothetical protein HW090_14165 [Pseudomonas sp. ABC1]
MKLDEVPQDANSIYGGHSKLLYAVDEKGHYQGAQSTGWDAEAYSTRQALAELQHLEAEAEAAWRRGEASPLQCLMYRYRLDEPALAQVTGLWRWRIRRHFRPQVYRRLGAALLARYAEAFGLPVEQLIDYQKDAA